MYTNVWLQIIQSIHIFIENEKPKLEDLNDHVAVKFAANWKELGRNLNVGEDLLKIIENNYPQDCKECCSRMLSEWLQLTPTATWGMLLEAVDKGLSPPVTHEGQYVYIAALTCELLYIPYGRFYYNISTKQ